MFICLQNIAGKTNQLFINAFYDIYMYTKHICVMYLSRSALTVDVHVPADVGVAQRVGDLTGNRLREERVIHNDLIGVTMYV